MQSLKAHLLFALNKGDHHEIILKLIVLIYAISNLHTATVIKCTWYQISIFPPFQILHILPGPGISSHNVQIQFPKDSTACN